ncbi:uncharacterized protein LOC131302963 isoform X1 [Rhododendron vialii]|uniref:uncharacterized protein LOC131302963 isoform X1 n=1 Tax=Rhododendron vialii TaxID=182163 RepID=UPI00265E8AE1|nr:uncharacterized protein LOC131302963 isoform X1 [Rhododendron vialii]
MKRLSEEASVHEWNLNSEGLKKARVLGTNCEELICLEQVGARIDGIRVLNPVDCTEIHRVENWPVMEEDRASGRSGTVERMDFDHDRVLGNMGLSSACGNSTWSEAIAVVDREKGKVILDFDLNVERMDFDLNLPAAEEGGNDMEFPEYTTRVGAVVVAERVDIIHILSDESEEDDTGKRGCVSVSGGRRYTREEKGKAKLVDSHSWLSLAMKPMQLDLIPERQELIISADSCCIQQQIDSQQEETTQLLETERVQIQREPEPMAAQESRQRTRANRYRDVACDNALRFARFNSNQNKYVDPLSQEMEVQTVLEEADKNVENFVGPFSAAMRLVKDRNLKSTSEQLINWKPSEGFDRNIVMPLVPSLLDLSMKVLAKNAEAIVSLEYVPDALKHRLADMLCDYRKMNARALDLLMQGSPTEIRIKDCSWLTDEHFTKIFGTFDSKSLKVLQLDLCGQCVHGDSLCKTIVQSQNSLPDLAIISLKGACRLTDVALKALVASTPALQSINLGECSLLTDTGISLLSACLGATLRELYIDNCHRIDARVVAPAILEFKRLEVLSVAGIQTVCDEFVVEVITKCGRNMKGLDLADCVKLTNTSMEVIGNNCSGLCSLNISNLHNLTDLAIQYLSNGCLSIQTLKLRQTSFSDEAIAAFLETSGKSLKELSLNNVRKVGPNTALSLAKSSKELWSLDLSWCRKITNEALGLIVDSCLSLKLVKLFGCTQISDEFLNGHSNSQVNIVGLNLTPILEHLNMLETEVGYLCYSPMTLSSEL